MRNNSNSKNQIIDLNTIKISDKDKKEDNCMINSGKNNLNNLKYHFHCISK